MGGAVEKIWFALGKEFAQRGHQVTHVSRRCGNLPDEEIIDGVQHIRVPGFDTPGSLVRLKWSDLLYTRRALKVLPKADILVTNTFWLPLLAPVGKCGKICVHVARYPKGQIRLYGKAARIHTVSRPIEEAIRKEAPNLAYRVKTIPNFVNSPRAQSLANQRSKAILYVGRVHPEKGLHLLLDAFGSFVRQGFHDWRLRIVGPWRVTHGGGGEAYFSSLRRHASAVCDRIEWIGPVFDSELLNSYYESSAFFVYPSLAERGETFGLAPLEAMAVGCPPVVSALECFQDFVEPGLNGWIFDHRSVNAATNLASALKTVADGIDGLSQVAARAIQTARNYTVSKIADKYLDDFAELAVQ